MSFGGDSGQGMPAIDQALQQFIQNETEKQKLLNLVHELNKKCWDTCVDKPSSKMDSRTESCLRNCVDRFIDTNLLVTQHIEKKIPKYLNQHNSM
jgi:import inner membrane translocase subunit TIM8